MAKNPSLGITMGDPAGNGSEISVKALADPSVYDRCRPVIIGDANCMEKAVKILGKEKIREGKAHKLSLPGFFGFTGNFVEFSCKL